MKLFFFVSTQRIIFNRKYVQNNKVSHSSMILIKICAKFVKIQELNRSSKSNRRFLVSEQGVTIPYAKRKIIFVDCPFPAFSIDKALFNFSLTPFKLV